ncbi:MAG: site-specific integrase [Bacillota bacterium]|nr:site-specific integrase [Bacillota bacterium]
MSLELKKRGDTWTFVVDIGRDPLTGKRKRKSKGGFKTKGECRAAAAEIISQFEKGTLIEETDLNLEDYLRKWLKEYAAKNTAYSTYSRYTEIINKTINPRLGKVPLAKLTALQIQEFYTYCIDTLKHSPNSVIRYHAVLSNALSMAVKWGLLNRNVCVNVSKPKKVHVEMKVLNESQLSKLLDGLKKTTLFIPVLIASQTGMRLGEICGLTWKAVDFDNSCLYVYSQLQPIDGKLLPVSLKTKSSRRKITLSSLLVNEFKELKNKQDLDRQDFGDGYNTGNYVVCQEDGRPYDPKYISGNFRRVIKEYKNKDGKCLAEQLEIPIIRFHDLRHTHATILLRADINPKVVSERLGHSSVSMTLDTYSHVLPDTQKDVANKLDEIFFTPTCQQNANNDEFPTE